MTFVLEVWYCQAMKDLDQKVNELVKAAQVTSDPAGKRVLAARQADLRDQLIAELEASLNAAA